VSSIDIVPYYHWRDWIIEFKRGERTMVESLMSKEAKKEVAERAKNGEHGRTRI